MNALSRQRSTLTVTIDLDPVAGWGDTAEDHRALVQRLLNDCVPHYKPVVEIAESSPSATTTDEPASPLPDAKGQEPA